MGILEETRFIERLQFFNGQRLFASDLQGLEAFNREMRWLHNRSLHQPGIGNGFAVYGKKGDREIKIKPGYAIDSLGREIVLTETWIEPVPPVAGEEDGKSVFYDLTVSYPDDTNLEEAETREGICLPRGVVRLREGPVLCWVRLKRDDKGNLHVKDPKLQNDVKDGLKIVLARAEVLNCQLDKDLSIAERRSARPAKQPYIACGTVKPAWKLDDNWVGKSSDTKLPTVISRELTAEIKTDSAGFITTPCYSARILGSRIRKTSQGTSSEASFVVDGLLNIVEPQPTSFKISVLLIIQALTGDGSIDINFDLAQNNSNINRLSDWEVVWMGIEG